MKECFDCNFTPCICPEILEFFDENQLLMEDLAELDAKERGKKRCLACQFYNCRCKRGHAKRISK